MLSRTADHLYWLGRYIERADTMSRLIQVGGRMNMLPDAVDGFRSEWVPILQASGTMEAFEKKYGEAVERNAVTHLFFDRENPSSVASCLIAARENARIVRTALSSAVWGAINDAYQELKALERTERSEIDITSLTEWASRQSALVTGAINNSLLRSDGYCFIHIGLNLERADNTARIMDVKYYVLLPDSGYIGSGLDNYQWQTLLRAMQMHRAFHWAYGGDITPSKIGDLLILNRACPRSLHRAVGEATQYLDQLARQYGTTSDAQTEIRRLLAELSEMDIEAVFDEGLHEFLTRFKNDIARVGILVGETYLSGEAA